MVRALRYLWALPTTLLATPLVVVALLSPRSGLRLVRGVLEVHGPHAAFVLRHLAFASGGALAMTLGHVVVGRDRLALAATRTHERVHVRQVERWGPLFVPVYLAASLEAWLRGGCWYADNRFEIEARVLSFDES